MQQRAGLLFLSLFTQRILLILDEGRWTVPTFARSSNLLTDAAPLLEQYSNGRLLPIELYLSQDRGFEYGTYVCAVEEEFLTTASSTIAWCCLSKLPNNLHVGLRRTLSNQIIRVKIDTIIELETCKS